MSSLLNSLPLLKPILIASITTCSISAPEKSLLKSLSNGNSNSLIRVWRTLLKCTLNIASLSFFVGKAMKKTSSKRPFRRISGGIHSMLFAVATTKTGEFFSDNHVRKVANTRLVVPLSPLLCAPANALSISSTQRTQGHKASAIWIIFRTRDSDSPTKEANKRPKSRRSKGKFHSLATVFAAKDFPVP